MSRQLIAAFGGIGRADDVEPRERPARPRREAPAEDRAHVALADVFQHALFQRADGLEHLREHQAVLDERQVGLLGGAGELLGQTGPVAEPLALVVIVEEPGIGLAAQTALASIQKITSSTAASG